MLKLSWKVRLLILNFTWELKEFEFICLLKKGRQLPILLDFSPSQYLKSPNWLSYPNQDSKPFHTMEMQLIIILSSK